MNATFPKPQDLKSAVPALLFILAVSLVYWAGLPGVPFHPDEATQVYMSSDVDLFFSAGPAALVWTPNPASPARQRYRLIDAPLARNLIGLGRLLSARPPLPADWDWGQTYAQNAAAGALPDPDLLATARLSVAWLFPASLWLAFLVGRRAGGRLTAWLFLLLLASNSLVWLHTRRAMAESGLLFSVLLLSWAALALAGRPPAKTGRPAGLAALPAALAFAAKQSALVLFPAGLVLLLVPALGRPARSLRRAAGELLLAGLLFGGLFLLLNPVLWSSPFQAFGQSLSARQDLLARQLADARQYAPASVMETPAERLAGMLGNLFLTPPAFAEVGNYRADTLPAEQAYLANPFNTLSAGPLAGLVLLSLSCAGLLAGLLKIARRAPDSAPLAVLLFITLLQAAGLLLAFALPWQRYVLLLLPSALFWAAFAAAGAVAALPRRRPAPAAAP